MISPDRRLHRGPFDLIGDVHGCWDELQQLVTALDYRLDRDSWTHPERRTVIFVGDLVDRGPRIVDTLKSVIGMAASGTALCVLGNHDLRLRQKLEGLDVPVGMGLAKTLAELNRESPEFRTAVKEFFSGLASHYVLDQGQLVVAHAGLKEEFHGVVSADATDFALVGQRTDGRDDRGVPVRGNWAAEYRGRAAVVYGHTPVQEPSWVNGTINIDTGCVFGGRLTALRWPERQLVSVPARAHYAESTRRFLADAGKAPRPRP